MHARFSIPSWRRALGCAALGVLPLLASCGQAGVDPNSVESLSEASAQPSAAYQRGQAPMPPPHCGSCPSNLPVIDHYGRILSEHPHQVVLTSRQQIDGLPCVLEVMGSDHSHFLSLDSEQLRRIAAGGKVVVRTDGAQYHVVVFGG